jgi:hypothetical protein
MAGNKDPSPLHPHSPISIINYSSHIFTMNRNENPTLRLLVVLLSIISLQTASVYSRVISPRQHTSLHRGGGISSSSLSTSTFSTNNKSTSSVQYAARRKYHSPSTIASVDVTRQVDHPPSLEELRAQLGPFALLVSNTIELTVITLGSFVSGGLLGYIGGGILNAPSTLFDKTANGILSRFCMLHSKAWGTCKQWGMLSASFSGFHNFVRMCRGDVEDGWNSVWGSALTGAFLNRGGGPQAMFQGAATYAGFTYFLDKFFASPSTQNQQQQSELMYMDVPLDD